MLAEAARRGERGKLPALGAVDGLLGQELTLREGRWVKSALKMGQLLDITMPVGIDSAAKPPVGIARLG